MSDQLKQRLDRAVAERDQLRSQLTGRAFTDVGFDPSIGVGRLLYDNFTGEATAEAVREFASSKGVEVPDPEPAEEAALERPGPPERSARYESQQRLQEMRNVSSPIIGSTIDHSTMLEMAAEGHEHEVAELLNRGRVEFPDFMLEQLQEGYG